MTSVLIVAFDGLQPAQVTDELMPNLSALAAGGVTFARHHAVFPSVTRTNVASIVTGRDPGGHGLAANTLVVREFDPHVALAALEPELSQIAHKTGRVLLAPTLADTLARHGSEYIAVGTGTSGNAYAQNPNAERSGGATIHPDFCLPRGLHGELVSRFGPWPRGGASADALLSHGVGVMTQYVLAERKPVVSLLWLCEPDRSQHAYGVGSETADRALREADRQFGRLLAWLDSSTGETDVLVVSDHGYSTISAVVDIEAAVREAGFPDGDCPGGVTVAPNGGSSLFYVHGRDWATADRLASWLMAQPWCGAIVSSEAVEGLEGTLAASVIGCEGERAPDVAVSMRWSSDRNEAGYAGHAVSTNANGTPGQGLHGSMSPHEMRNVLFARGRSFKRGLVSTVPSGNVDLTPTVLHLLGLTGEAPLDGRVLSEATAGGPHPDAVDWSTETHRAERTLGSGRYSQQITTSKVGTTGYVGSGWASPA